MKPFRLTLAALAALAFVAGLATANIRLADAARADQEAFASIRGIQEAQTEASLTLRQAQDAGSKAPL